MIEAENNGYACPRCTVGRCSPRMTTLSEMHLGQLLAIPNLLAYVCDICNFVEFPQETLEALWQELFDEQLVEEYPPAMGQQKGTSTFGE